MGISFYSIANCFKEIALFFCTPYIYLDHLPHPSGQGHFLSLDLLVSHGQARLVHLAGA